MHDHERQGAERLVAAPRSAHRTEGESYESPLSVVHTLHISLGTRGARAPLLYSRSAVVVGSLAVDAFSRQLST